MGKTLDWSAKEAMKFQQRKDQLRAAEAKTRKHGDFPNEDEWRHMVRREQEKQLQREKAQAVPLEQLKMQEDIERMEGGYGLGYIPSRDNGGFFEVREQIEIVRDDFGDKCEVRIDGQKVGEIDPRSGRVVPVNTINAIKPTIHKAGHFPIGWMMEAFERAEQSDKIITIQLEKEGVTVIGQEGDSYEAHTLSWPMMEHAEVNPVILGIEKVEKHLDTLGRLKQRVRA